jgi:hypothetical protein
MEEAGGTEDMDVHGVLNAATVLQILTGMLVQ